jgi:uncharacterized protein YciI
VRKLFLVSLEHGGSWDWSKDLREQELWDAHAAFMDELVENGFVVLGGPLDEKDVLLVVDAADENAIHERFAADPWIVNGMLTITNVRPWTVLLGGPSSVDLTGG